jgi:hypothetical protein
MQGYHCLSFAGPGQGSVAHHVTCPTLIIDGTEDHFLPEDGKQLYETLICPKDYLLFSTADGAEEHCQVGALAMCHEQLFNWLKTRSLMGTFI